MRRRAAIFFAAMVPVCAAQAAPGGTLRLTAHAIGSTLDPHIAYLQLQLQVSATVYDGLMTYPKAAGPVTGGAIPDLADVRPVPQDGGLTYVFHLRDGVRFSNGKAVDVEDVAASFRRMFKVHGPTAGSYFGVLVGADACLKDAEHCALAGGVVADPAQHTVTFHLTRPDPDFLNQLGFAQAAIVPADTPAHDMGNEAPFGTGPYRYVRYSPNGGMTLERNPYFREWSHEAQPAAYPDRIEYRFGLDEEAEVSAVENGQYDWMGDGVPLDRLGEVGRRYTDRVTISDFPNIYYLALNVNEAPFNDVRVRQALNYAVNRHAMVIHEGGEALAQPACQMLPIGLAGFEPSCAYTVGAAPDHPAHAWKAPDLDRARALVRASGTAGQTVVIVAPAGATYLAIATELRSTLESLGYVASVRGINQAVQFTYIQNSANHVQAGLTGWIADYPAPAAFVQTLFSCASFHPRSDNSINMSGFCDPAIDALMDRAGTVSMTDMPAGLALWAQADRAIMEKAPAVPLTQIRRIDFVGPRVHNVVVSPVYQLLLSQLQVR